jgi:hypothetical protein
MSEDEINEWNASIEREITRLQQHVRREDGMDY